MTFSVIAIAALAAASSFSCMVAASTAAASQKRKIAKKGGSLSVWNDEAYGDGQNDGPTVPSGPPGPPGPNDGIPIWGPCWNSDECAIPPGLDRGFCTIANGRAGKCQSGQPGAICEVTSDCVVQYDLVPPHAVCRGLKVHTGNVGIEYRKCQQWVQCTYNLLALVQQILTQQYILCFSFSFL